MTKEITLSEIAENIQFITKSDVDIRYSKYMNNWFILTHMESKVGNLLGSLIGRGATPSEALRNLWEKCLTANCIVVDPFTEQRKQWHWVDNHWEYFYGVA